MDTAKFIASLIKAGLDEGDARYYAATYPPAEWAEILAWAKAPPGLDACDDYEADEFYA